MSRKPSILLTAFRGTSAERLVRPVTQCKTLMLPNDKRRDSQMLIQLLSTEKFDYVVSLGQKPNIKDKVYIEAAARDGARVYGTDFDCCWLLSLFEGKGLRAKLSHNAGTSYCNQLYLNGLRYISEKPSEIKMVFVHIPFWKNITDFDDFQKRFLEVIFTELP